MALEGEDQRINANTSAVAVPPAVPHASGLEVPPLWDSLLQMYDMTAGVLTGQREERTNAENNRKELQGGEIALLQGWEELTGRCLGVHAPLAVAQRGAGTGPPVRAVADAPAQAPVQEGAPLCVAAGDGAAAAAPLANGAAKAETAATVAAVEANASASPGGLRRWGRSRSSSRKSYREGRDRSRGRAARKDCTAMFASLCVVRGSDDRRCVFEPFPGTLKSTVRIPARCSGYTSSVFCVRVLL